MRAKTFLADSETIMDSLPVSVRYARNFSDTGRVLCDATLTDFIRGSATKLSWLGLADIINEMKETAWTRDVVLRYLRMCDFLMIAPENVPVCLPPQYKLSREWVRNLYLSDFRGREDELQRELAAEVGDAVLKLDWTKGAAVRCKGNFLFNAMTGANQVLASVLTATSAPNEAAERVLWQLQSRGVRPKVVYVDDECCGAWPVIINRVWPACLVRLDSLHALMRLTSTTVSTQHPWHAEFCGKLSEAIFTYDQHVLERIQKALLREKRLQALTKSQKYKYVPRIIEDPGRIAKAIDDVINGFRNRVHNQMGVLLTTQTNAAWDNLRKHVLQGCLCDSPGIDVNIYGEGDSLQIGGQTFCSIRKLRGTSSLEGFHSHQKRWLGPLGTHSQEAGMALLTDGNLRWNRQRSKDDLVGGQSAPAVYAPGLHQEVQGLRQRLGE